MSEESKLNVIEWDMMDHEKFVSSSVVTSFGLRTVSYPLVLVKTRLQVQRQNTVYKGSLDAFIKIVRTEGFCGLYRGFWINSIQVLPGVIYLSSYEKTRDLLANYTNVSDSKTKAFLSGGISSAVSTTLIIPFDVVSQHIMMAMTTRQSSTLHESQLKSTFFKPLSLDKDEVRRRGIAITTIRQLYREGGMRSYYRGYLASLICFVPSAATWWMLYEKFNEFFYGLSMAGSKSYVVLHCTSGALSGAAVSIMSNPLDLFRTNIQVHRPSSYISAVKYIWRQDKWRIFNKGLSARLTHSCVSSGLIAFGYETMKRFSIDDKYRDQLRW